MAALYTSLTTMLLMVYTPWPPMRTCHHSPAPLPGSLSFWDKGWVLFLSLQVNFQHRSAVEQSQRGRCTFLTEDHPKLLPLQDPGAMPRSKAVCSPSLLGLLQEPGDFAPEGPGDGHFLTPTFHLPSPCSFMLQWEKPLLSFPTFIQEEPQQRELR